MSNAEKKAAEAVVRAAKKLSEYYDGWPINPIPLVPLCRAVARLLREEAKTKEKRRGK